MTPTDPYERFRKIFGALEEDLQTNLDPDDDWRTTASEKGFRFYQGTWFDGGLHFESWVTNADIERQSIPVAFHIEAPREKTGVRRADFNAYFLDAGARIMDDWEGYTIAPKSYQTIIRRIPITNNLLDDLKREYHRFAALAPIVNAAIAAASD